MLLPQVVNSARAMPTALAYLLPYMGEAQSGPGPPPAQLQPHIATPKHGSWLNIAEIELSALNGQCLRRRIPSSKEMRTDIAAWQSDRNHRGAPVNWRFTTKDARIKLTRLYPKL